MSVIVVVGTEQALREILTRLISIEEKVDSLISKEDQLMATIDEVLAGVTEESSVADSLVQLAANLHQLYLDALAGVTLPPAVQAKLDSISGIVAANKTKMAASVTANTPATPA